MPVIYNGGQSQLEYYAINGNVSVNGGLGRPQLTTQTTLQYGASFKNPFVTGNPNDAYGPTHTNALHDAQTPYRGKSTNDGYDSTNSFNGFVARKNYNGGDDFDVLGGNAALQAGTSYAGLGLGRKTSIILNVGTFGYGPDQSGGGSTSNEYQHPNTSGNIGQVII
jgi:hypothetical protein